MNFVGWTLRGVPESERDALIDSIPAMACDVFNLCATAGCGCDGSGGAVVCRGWREGSAFPVVGSEGPDWSVTAHWIGGGTVRLDLFFELPVLGVESVAFQKRLLGLGYTMLIRTGMA